MRSALEPFRHRQKSPPDSALRWCGSFGTSDQGTSIPRRGGRAFLSDLLLQFVSVQQWCAYQQSFAKYSKEPLAICPDYGNSISLTATQFGFRVVLEGHLLR